LIVHLAPHDSGQRLEEAHMVQIVTYLYTCELYL
jgi:hypothetical protein